MEPQNIPFFAHEGIMSRMERTVKRLWIALIITIILVFASNALWLWYISGYDIETYDYVQDGFGVNIIGDKNGVDYDVPKVTSSEEGTQKENQKENGTP